MKHLLLSIIRLYWRLLPEGRRRPCLYRESCSKYVYRTTQTDGLLSGLRALRHRVQCCRPGYSVHHNGEAFELKLAKGGQVQEHEISERILLPYKNTLSKYA